MVVHITLPMRPPFVLDVRQYFSELFEFGRRWMSWHCDLNHASLCKSSVVFPQCRKP